MSKVRTETLINRIEEETDKYRFDTVYNAIYVQQVEDEDYYYACHLRRQNVINIADELGLVSQKELARYEYYQL